MNEAIEDQDTDGAAGESERARRERYNLAARVYGSPPPPHPRDRLSGDGYNLAARVYGNGTRPAETPATRTGAATLAPPVDGGSPVPAAAQLAAPATAPAEARRRFSLRTFESLGDAGYRWYLLSMLGQMASLNMQQLVRGFLVFDLTGSYAALGTMFLVNSIPGLLLSAVGGVLADRVRRKKYVVQAGQLFNGGNALVLALLLVSDQLIFEHLLVAAAVHGTVMSLMMPARQAMLPEVIGRERLTNAVALSAAGMSATRLIAPSIGGFVIAAAGAAWVYFSITGLYLFATAVLMLVPAESAMATAGARGREARQGGGFSDLVDGFRYMWRDRTLRTLLWVSILFSVLSMQYLFLLPGIVASVLNRGPGELGLLMAIAGLGSLIGSLGVASLPSRRRGRTFLLASLFLGVALLMFSASSSYWITAALMIAVGIGDAGRLSLSMVLVQEYVRDEYRGRVMSVLMMQRSIATFATFIVGLAAAVVGVQLAIGSLAVGLIVAALLLLLTRGLSTLD